MARRKTPASAESAAKKLRERRMSSAQRSSYFARREAAKVLRAVLHGDARRRSVGSIKSLVYSPSVRNKKATFALVCQTLKYLPIIRDVLEVHGVLTGKWKRQGELMYIITYDILFGQADLLVGDAEKFLLLRKDALLSALSQLLVRKRVKHKEDLITLYEIPDVSKPCYVRVNTLRLDVESALHQLEKHYTVKRDDMVPDLLILPPGTDLHNHPLITSGSAFIQGKASSMVAVALGPKPGWEVLDACSAPGNKTVHLAALMRGKGKIIACELNKERVKRLEDTVKLAGAANVEVLHEDFLNLNPKDPMYSKVHAILLDPSCSGSGTVANRLDHLLPSSRTGDADAIDLDRLRKLAAFQKKALAHALSFPAVEKVVYSTCSIHQTENEDVISSVLHLAGSYGFELATPFPLWPCRGRPVVQGSEHLLRTDPAEDKEGFFIALFIRKGTENSESGQSTSDIFCRRKSGKKKRPVLLSHPINKLFRMWLHSRPGKHKRPARKV